MKARVFLPCAEGFNPSIHAQEHTAGIVQEHLEHDFPGWILQFNGRPVADCHLPDAKHQINPSGPHIAQRGLNSRPVIRIPVPQHQAAVLRADRSPQGRIDAERFREPPVPFQFSFPRTGGGHRDGYMTDPDVLLVVGVHQVQFFLLCPEVVFRDPSQVLGSQVFVEPSVPLGAHVPGHGHQVIKRIAVLPRHHGNRPAVLSVKGRVIQQRIAPIRCSLSPDLAGKGMDAHMLFRVAPCLSLVLGIGDQAFFVDADHPSV